MEAGVGPDVRPSQLEEALLRADLSALHALAPEGDLNRPAFAPTEVC